MMHPNLRGRHPKFSQRLGWLVLMVICDPLHHPISVSRHPNVFDVFLRRHPSFSPALGCTILMGCARHAAVTTDRRKVVRRNIGTGGKRVEKVSEICRSDDSMNKGLDQSIESTKASRMTAW